MKAVIVCVILSCIIRLYYNVTNYWWSLNNLDYLRFELLNKMIFSYLIRAGFFVSCFVLIDPFLSV